MNAFLMQCKMEIIRVFRNPYFIFWTLFMPILFYFIFTRLVSSSYPDNDLWNAHYLMSMTTFAVMGSSIMIFGIRLVQEKIQGWTTFMKITPLPSWAYFTSKMIGQTAVHLFIIIVIFLAGVLINGVSLPLSQWILSGLWILLAALPFLAIGNLVGSMKRVETASGVSNFIYLGLAILGGMWFPMDIFPTLMQQIAEWLPSFHFGNGAWMIIRGKFPEWNSYVVLIAYLILLMALSILIRRKQQAY